MGQIPSESTVLKARPVGNEPQSPFAPAPIDEVVSTIAAEQPDLVFAPHVETSSGMMLPDDYIRQAAEAVHAQGGLFRARLHRLGHRLGGYAGTGRGRARQRSRRRAGAAHPAAAW